MSGDGAGDGALGGGGHTGANGSGDLGGDTEYVDLSFQADDEREAFSSPDLGVRKARLGATKD